MHSFRDSGKKRTKEHFIRMVYMRPPLWNKKLKDHKNRLALTLLWNEIAQELGSDVPSCRKQWKSLIDHYRALVNQKQDNTKPTVIKWAYFEQLHFMKEMVVDRSRKMGLLNGDFGQENSTSAEENGTEQISIEFQILNSDKILNGADETDSILPEVELSEEVDDTQAAAVECILSGSTECVADTTRRLLHPPAATAEVSRSSSSSPSPSSYIHNVTGGFQQQHHPTSENNTTANKRLCLGNMEEYDQVLAQGLANVNRDLEACDRVSGFAHFAEEMMSSVPQEKRIRCKLLVLNVINEFIEGREPTISSNNS